MREAELEELNELRELTKDSFPKIGGPDLIDTSAWGGSIPPRSDSEEQGGSEEEPTAADQTS